MSEHCKPLQGAPVDMDHTSIISKEYENQGLVKGQSPAPCQCIGGRAGRHGPLGGASAPPSSLGAVTGRMVNGSFNHFWAIGQESFRLYRQMDKDEMKMMVPGGFHEEHLALCTE